MADFFLLAVVALIFALAIVIHTLSVFILISFVRRIHIVSYYCFDANVLSMLLMLL